LAPRLGIDENPAVVLVGPRGAGKTTSLAKLAVLRGRFANERPARLLSLDMSRAAAHLQLQSVAETHNIAFEEVPAAYLLPGLIAEARQKETVFVDTPGYSGADSKAAEAAAAAFAECPQLDVHLVVPGYMKARDLRLCIQRYASFRPTKLLVTKLDETQSFGSIFSEAARAGLKLSFVAHGPGIPNDIRPASYKDLLSMPAERAKAVA
jgi:flagellar biosynthesis protein FlhF